MRTASILSPCVRPYKCELRANRRGTLPKYWHSHFQWITRGTARGRCETGSSQALLFSSVFFSLFLYLSLTAPVVFTVGALVQTEMVPSFVLILFLHLPRCCGISKIPPLNDNITSTCVAANSRERIQITGVAVSQPSRVSRVTFFSRATKILSQFTSATFLSTSSLFPDSLMRTSSHNARLNGHFSNHDYVHPRSLVAIII